MKRTQSIIINGISTLFLIFAVFCIGILCLLSLGQSRIDYALSEDTLEHTLQYYDASSNSFSHLNTIDEQLEEQFSHSSSSKEYFSSIKNLKIVKELSCHYDTKEHILSWVVPISEKNELLIQIQILYPKQSGDSYYEILTFGTQASGDWNPDTHQQLYQGGFSS